MSPRTLFAFPVLLLPAFVASSALAQQRPAPADPAIAAATADQVIELSPFQVTSDSFKGYTASQTLAGSRLKMNVDEVASSIQILTPEFMSDVGATNVNELFLFTTSTESSGINGNFSAFSTGTTSTNDENSRINPQGAQRVRGIASADLTRNYQLTLIPSDRFNTELTEINRGANAILFGLGSPAGIVNTQLSRAKFKDTREVRVGVDDQGSVRAELDVNEVVIPQTLAVRLTAVRDDRKYYQEPAFENDRRQYGAFTLRPWKHATLRGSVESGGRFANRPNTIPPASTLASWFANQPLLVQRMRAVLASVPGASLTVPDNYPLVYSPIAQSWRPNNTNSYLTTASIPNDVKLAILRNAVIYHDNNATHPRMIFHPNMSRQLPVVFLPGSVNPGGGPGGSAAVESSVPVINNPIAAMNPDGVGTAPAYNYFAPEQPWRTNPVIVPISLTNLAMFDFTRQMLSGSAAFQNDKWTHQNFAFEQTLLDDRAGFELVYDRQTYRRSAYVPFQNYTGIFVDLMQDYLGMTNPNLGRPFVMDRVSLRTQQDERESFRATGFYRLDPERQWSSSRLGRWFGRHTVTGVFSTYDQEQTNSSWGQYYQDAVGGVQIFSAADPLGSNRRKVNNIVYLGDSILGARSENDVRLTPLTTQKLWQPGRTVTIRTFNPARGAYEDVTLRTDEKLEDRSRDTQQIETLAATWSGSFLQNHLIGLFGWRHDAVVSERRQAVAGADLLADVSTLRTPAALLSRIDDTFRTTSWSVVAKLPERWTRLPFSTRINAYYGESENFSLSATANDIFGGQLPSPSGRTREFGLMFNLWQDKLVLRVNRYESQIANSLADTKYGVLVNQGILKTYESLVEAQRYGNQGAVTPNYGLVVDAVNRMKGLIPAGTIRDARLENPTTGGDFARNDLTNLGDTEDVVGKGTELELIYNPTNSWRIALNVAKQQTVVDNYAPRVGELWSKFEPILGAGGLIGHLRYFNDPNTNPPNFISYPAPTPGDAQMTVAQWMETNVLSSYRNQKKQEGRVSAEQRPWRVNLVTNYTFLQGRLKGVGVGSAVRWQDGAAIGYPTQLIGDTLVADIERPHVGPAITNIDAWLRYKRRIFRSRLDWTIELRVQNLNHTAQDLIPVRAELTTDYRVAQYRVGPPRVWSLSNTIKF